MNKLKQLYTSHQEIFSYLVVGVLTTIFAWLCKFLWNYIFYKGTLYPTPLENLILSSVNWISGVIFGFFTNRRFVFHSHASLLPEAGKFVASRLTTYLIDILVMQGLVLFLGIDLYLATIISTVIVVILNYIFSKIFVFKGTSK